MNILLQRKNFMVYTQKFWSLISKTHPPPHICQMYADSSRFKIFDFSYHFTSSNWCRLFVDTYFTVWLHRDWMIILDKSNKYMFAINSMVIITKEPPALQFSRDNPKVRTRSRASVYCCMYWALLSQAILLGKAIILSVIIMCCITMHSFLSIET